MSDNYLNLMSDIIKKQIVILGPQIALLKARNVPGLQVSDSGDVSGLEGDPQMILQKLIDEYVSLSGLIVKKAMEPLLSKYPEIQIGSEKEDEVK